jgi:hypothetical protein
LHGSAAIPRERIASVQGIAQVQDIADRLAARDERPAN